MRLYELGEDIAIIERMMEDDDIDQESFRKALDSLNQEMHAKIANIGLLVKQLGADVDVISATIRDLQAKKRSAENRIAWLKEYVAPYVAERSVKTPLVTVSRQKGRERAVVDAVTLLPPDCVVYPDPQPDKTLILRRLKAGEDVPGAHLDRGPDFVTVR